jgi:uncharacterized protein YciW
MSQSPPDVIDRLVGVKKGSVLHEIRAARPEARNNAQKSFQALFAPENPGALSLQERYAVATMSQVCIATPAFSPFIATAWRRMEEKRTAVRPSKRRPSAAQQTGPMDDIPTDR